MANQLSIKSNPLFSKENMIVKDAQAFRNNLGDIHQLGWDIWDEKRKNSPFDIPIRSQITMQDLGVHIPAMSIYEIRSDDRLQLRMCGSDVEVFFGLCGTGKFLEELAEPEARDLVWTFFNNIMTIPCAGFSRETMTSGGGKRGEISNLILPITNRDGTAKLGMSLMQVKFRDYQAPKNILARPPHEKMITHKELHEGKYIDLGFGLPF